MPTATKAKRDPKAIEKRKDRAKLCADARKIVDAADAEKRKMNSEERASYDKIMDAVGTLKEQIDSLEALCDADDDSDEDRDDMDAEGAAGADEEREGEGDDEEDEEEDDERARSTRKRMQERRGRGRKVPPEGRGQSRTHRDVQRPGESRAAFQHRVRRNQPAYRAVFADYLLRGLPAIQAGLASRAISADNDITGGYLVAPQQFVADLIIFVNNLVYVRQKATKYTVTAAQTLGAPSLDTDISDSNWTAELATGNEDASMAFGKRELQPHPLAKRIKVSNKLLRMSAIPAEKLVMERLAYKFAVTEEEAFYTGTGGSQPLGLFTASAMGISTGRDVVAGTTTAPTADGLRSAKYTLKAQYWPEAEWHFNRTVVSLLAQLKDSMGRYLWGEGGINSGEPDQLLGFPINMSEYTPNTMTTGLYYGGLFCCKHYWIADSEQLTIERLVELYAETNQTGFIARRELDAMPTLEEAFVRLKLA